jgi:vacuolar-type H+-ATPase subunit H
VDTSVLGAVIEAEQEIQTRIEAERKKARERIDGVKAEAAQSAAEEAERLRRESAATLVTAKAGALARAAELLRRTERLAEELAALSDTRLQQIMAQQIHHVLPGADRHDRPDVKS